MELCRRAHSWLKDLWLTYTLNTALYMCEPWECVVFNSVLVTILAMLVYTGYVFIPGHVLVFSRILQDYLHGGEAQGAGHTVAPEAVVSPGTPT